MSKSVMRVTTTQENSILKNLKPESTIGISVIKVYAQIARFGNNPSRIDELKILRNAIKNANGKAHLDSRYTLMKVSDVRVCFGSEFNSFPTTAFVIPKNSK